MAEKVLRYTNRCAIFGALSRKGGVIVPLHKEGIKKAAIITDISHL